MNTIQIIALVLSIVSIFINVLTMSRLKRHKRENELRKRREIEARKKPY